MTDRSDSQREATPDPPEQPTHSAGGMESLEKIVGRAVDPGIELEPPELEEPETVVGDIPSPAPGAGGSARTGPGGPGAPDSDAAQTGRHQVRGEIARGGMGAIFKVRDTDLRRSLAMKVILGESSGSGATGASAEPVPPELLQRFLEEAQVTAQLVHPGVVPVHELGIDNEGRVYFTMSLVRGETLARIIRKARDGEDGWTMTRALQVLLRVCETMAFAHDKGVIHRDLKPDNVMVGKFGETYVMDWGLAKVLGREDSRDLRLKDVDQASMSRVRSNREDAADSDSPLMTMDGAVVGTPAYMPPEQADGRIEEVGKHSDVYAIGALLYQLLTGEAPYVRSGARPSPYAVLAAVMMGPPQPVHEIDAAAPEELEAICGKAMARDPAGRYATAEELAEDLHRFLSGHVVQAHRTGALIEMKKWIARNKAIAATAAAACVVIAGLTTGFLLSLADERDRAVTAEADVRAKAVEVSRERDRAVTAEKDAKTKTAEATQERERAVSAEADARDLAAEADRQRELADARATEAVEERERAQKLAEFMLVDLRDGLRPIGRLDLLGQVARKSLEYYQSLPTEGLSAEQRRARAMAFTNVGDVLRAQGDFAGGLESFRRVVEIRARVAALEPTNVLWQDELRHAHHRVGDILVWMEDYPGALASHRTATEVAERLAALDPSDPGPQYELYRSYARVSDALRLCGDGAAARESTEAALAIIERLAAAHPENVHWQYEVGNGHTQIGVVSRMQGDLAETLERFCKALRIRERLAAANPADQWLQAELAFGHERVGRERLLQGDAAGAATDFRRYLEIMEALAAAQPASLHALDNLSRPHLHLGNALLTLGDLDGALQSLQACVEIRERLDAQDPTNAHWKLFHSQSHAQLGTVLLRMGRYAEAVKVCRRAEQIHAANVKLAPHHASQHPWYVSLRKNAEILAGERQVESAAEYRDLGYAHYATQEFVKSVRAFERALEDDAIRSDLERANLYNAACSAALSSAMEHDQAEADRAQAIAWLAADLTLRRTLFDTIQERLAAGAGDAGQLELQKGALLTHLTWAHTGDSDLASIRGTPEFEALFEGLPTGE